jgi:hypothetical protein
MQVPSCVSGDLTVILNHNIFCYCRLFVFKEEWRADELRGCLPPFGELCFVFPFASPKYNIEIHGTIILSVALHGCETRSLALREERRLRVFEISVLKKILALKRHEVTSERRRLHEEIYDMFFSQNINRVNKWRRMRWMGLVARAGREAEMYIELWRSNLRGRLLWRSCHRW